MAAANEFVSLQTSMKHVPKILVSVLQPIVSRFFQSFPQKVADRIDAEYPGMEDDEFDKTVESTISESLKNWLSNEDFYKRRADEVSQKYAPDVLMRYWEDYTKQFMKIVPISRNYHPDAINACNFDLERPSFYTFIKNVYHAVIMELRKDSAYFNSEDEMDEMISKKIRATINNLIQMSKVIECHNRMDQVNREYLESQNSESDSRQDKRRRKKRKQKEEPQEEVDDSNPGELPMDIAVTALAEIEEERMHDLQEPPSPSEPDKVLDLAPNNLPPDASTPYPKDMQSNDDWEEDGF